MGVFDLFFLAVGLSMDAFAASICEGFKLKRPSIAQALLIALAFGGFQAGMPVVGWFLGVTFAEMIQSVDHWIAFALLVGLGAKMLWDAAHEDDDQADRADEAMLKGSELLGLAVATSIDALAVGVTFAFLGVSIAGAAAIIGLTTFTLSLIGVLLGAKIGTKLGKGATIAGGVVLIVIGVKILLEHLFE